MSTPSTPATPAHELAPLGSSAFSMSSRDAPASHRAPRTLRSSSVSMNRRNDPSAASRSPSPTSSNEEAESVGGTTLDQLANTKAGQGWYTQLVTDRNPDMTIFRRGQRPIDIQSLPEIMYQLVPSASWDEEHDATKAARAETIRHDVGQLPYTIFGERLYSVDLPDQIQSSIPGDYLEYWFRNDPRVTWRDVIDRIHPDRRPEHNSTLSNRRMRFRKTFRMVCWTNKKQPRRSEEENSIIEEMRSKNLIARDETCIDTRGVTPGPEFTRNGVTHPAIPTPRKQRGRRDWVLPSEMARHFYEEGVKERKMAEDSQRTRQSLSSGNLAPHNPNRRQLQPTSRRQSEAEARHFEGRHGDVDTGRQDLTRSRDSRHMAFDAQGLPPPFPPLPSTRRRFSGAVSAPAASLPAWPRGASRPSLQSQHALANLLRQERVARMEPEHPRGSRSLSLQPHAGSGEFQDPCPHCTYEPPFATALRGIGMETGSIPTKGTCRHCGRGMGA